MPVHQEYLDYVIDQLKAFGPVLAKRMFGGAGLYHQCAIFGLVTDDALFFKVNDGKRDEYEAAGSGPFRPFGTYAMSYYEVPADVMEDPEELAQWARRAVDAGRKESRKMTVPRKGKKTGKQRSRKS